MVTTCGAERILPACFCRGGKGSCGAVTNALSAPESPASVDCDASPLLAASVPPPSANAPPSPPISTRSGDVSLEPHALIAATPLIPNAIANPTCFMRHPDRGALARFGEAGERVVRGVFEDLREGRVVEDHLDERVDRSAERDD